MTKIKVNINELVTEGLQMRLGLNSETLEDYTEHYASGSVMAPVSVVKDPETDECYLVDGYHRITAADRAGLSEIDAEVVGEGDYTAALKFALKANATNGLRRTNADKRKAVLFALENRSTLFGHDPSCRELADMCAVSHTFANRFLNNGLSTVDSGAAKAPSPAPDRSRGVKKLLKEKKDRFGQDIPDELLPAFHLESLKQLCRAIEASGDELEKHMKAQDPAFAKVEAQALVNLRNTARHLKFAACYCVCPFCVGDGCRSCGDQGWLTYEQYKALAEEDRPQRRTK